MSHNRQYFLLKTLEPVITTSNSASTSSEPSLPYIPGSMIWGYIATQIYGETSDSWEIFHSSEVKVSDAFPIFAGKMSFPCPLSYHAEKGKSGDIAGCGLVSLSEINQPLQIRNRQIIADRSLHETKTFQSTKTAIEVGLGVAAKSQLYNIDAVSAGLEFVFFVEAQDDQRVEKFCSSLKKSSNEMVIYLGRSRSAEFGKCKVQKIDEEVLQASNNSEQAITEGYYAWALSDIAIFDSNGYPSSNLSELGIGDVNFERSYIRTRRYTPYNAKWNQRTLSRNMIERGSIIALNNPLLEIGFHWIGGHNSSGSGLIYLGANSPYGNEENILPSNQLQFTENDIVANTTQGRDELVTWLEVRTCISKSRRDAPRQTEFFTLELTNIIEDSIGLAGGHYLGPRKNQFNSVARIVKNQLQRESVNQAGLLDALSGENGIASPDDEAWNQFYSYPNKSFRTWLISKIEQNAESHNWDAFAKALSMIEPDKIEADYIKKGELA